MIRRRFLATLMLAALPLSAAAEPLCITHALGRDCLPAPARRIAAVESRHVENLIALGLVPVAVTSRAAVLRYLPGQEDLLAETLDLGLPATPNLELLLALGPDLILGNARTLQRNHAMLAAIAPTLAFEVYPPEGGDIHAAMLDTFRAVARATGRDSMAESFLAGLADEIAAGRAQLAAAGWAGRRVVLGNINAGITGADVMLFNSNSMPAELLRQLGLDYAHDDPAHREKGFQVTTVESLLALQQVDFLYLPFNQEGVDKLMASPVWRGLAFVREGRFTAIPYRQMYAGPLTARDFVRDVVRILAP